MQGEAKETRRGPREGSVLGKGEKYINQETHSWLRASPTYSLEQRRGLRERAGLVADWLGLRCQQRRSDFILCVKGPFASLVDPREDA